jgi:hypothetical protein
MLAEVSWGCSGCAPLVRAYLFERGDFLLTLMLVTLPIVAIVCVVCLLAVSGGEQ